MILGDRGSRESFVTFGPDELAGVGLSVSEDPVLKN